MAFDYENFKPSSVDDLLNGLGAAISSEAQTWFADSKEQASGYLKSISEAVIQTQIDFAANRISKQNAEFLMRSHKRAMKVYLNGLKYETFEFRQTILNTAVRALGYAVRNLTGLNIAPQLVR
ncbi:hypothetical protein [Roseibium sp. RKSG952]|uniref:hypothetical protein n=1 Tax=Roseibium sp. RKSG952 TaxID=2529384 RepID=UPI0012BD426F|nr:hypothetical protein [Roseibium sp. RKSG952]MTI03238.1 hypothetical protein [Roseibium sp. RKSG952]